MMIESPTSIERARKRPFFAKAQMRPLEGNSYRGFVESSHPTAALWLQPPTLTAHKETRDIPCLIR